jgi:hypothetical protein
MSEAARTRCRRALVALLVLAGSACSPGGASTPAADLPATTRPAPVSAGERTVVERTIGAVVMRTVILRSAGRASASMEVIAPADDVEILVAEEIRIGDDHYVHLPAAVQVLGDDVWIHFDVTDHRHVRFLEENPIGLFDEVDRPTGPHDDGVRVRRRAVSPPPAIERPPADRTVSFGDLDELPGVALPLPR